MNKHLIVVMGIAMTVTFCPRTDASDWETDFAKASATAKSSGKYMLLDFSGSDWCGWCMKLDKEVFSQSAFETFAKTNLICVLVDFPRSKKQSAALKKQNAQLAQKYGVKGYPTVIVLNPDGEPACTTGYEEGGAKKYVEHLKEIIVQDKSKNEKRNESK